MAGSSSGRRHTSAAVFHSRASQDAREVAAQEARNALLQANELLRLINETLTSSEPFRLRLSTIAALNQIALEGLHDEAGQYRKVPINDIGTSSHQPPPPPVLRYVEELCEYVSANWEATPVHLSAYVMWRLNWIHPFVDGNGRTTRAVSYLVLCARLESLLPGHMTVPERITETDETREAYYKALEAADEAEKQGVIDVSKMESLLRSHVAMQVQDAMQETQPSSQLSAKPQAQPVTPSSPRSGTSKEAPGFVLGTFLAFVRGRPAWLRYLLIGLAVLGTLCWAIWGSLPDATKQNLIDSVRPPTAAPQDSPDASE